MEVTRIMCEVAKHVYNSLATHYAALGHLNRRLRSAITLEADVARTLSLDTGKAYKEVERLEKMGEDGMPILQMAEESCKKCLSSADGVVLCWIEELFCKVIYRKIGQCDFPIKGCCQAEEASDMIVQNSLLCVLKEVWHCNFEGVT
ncbi:hypothetical protein Tco_0619350 [Tanacetum coccineum]